MKTKSIKAGIVLAIILSGITFSSFKPGKTKSKSATVASITDWKEYQKVNDFVREQLCKPISEDYKIDTGNDKSKYFSRCPSGYNSDITTKPDSVKTDRFVNGKIVFYKGCSPIYVCDYKVCVAKNFAMVRNKGSKQYMSVSAWLKAKKEHNAVQVKSKSNM